MSKRAEVLQQFLDKLCRSDTWYQDRHRYDFLSACIEVLSNRSELMRSELPELIHGHRDPKTYSGYLVKFGKHCETYQSELRLLCNEVGLASLPTIGVNKSTGGAGNQTSFEIVAQTVDESSLLPAQGVSDDTATISVDYHSINLIRIPWYLRLSKTLLSHRNGRKLVVLMFVALVVIMITALFAGSFGWISKSLAQLFIVLVAVLLIPALWRLMLLIRHKQVLLTDLSMPIGAVALAQPAETEEGLVTQVSGRDISAVKIAGDCPICLHRYGLRESVLLAHANWFSKQIIGECSENPTEHRFSFDKERMKGGRIE